MRFAAVAAILIGGCVQEFPENTLVRVDSELAGGNCDAGGVAIHTGPDTDRTGALDDDELTSTHYVCSPNTALQCDGGTPLVATVTIHDGADFAQLAGVSCIDGDLIIAGPDLDALPA